MAGNPQKQEVMILTVSDIAGRRLTRDDFVFFWGHTLRAEKGMGKACLSQWFPAPMVADGVFYFCMEQYIMAAKARLFGDTDAEARIMAEHSQMAIKKLGRRVQGYDDAAWSAAREQVAVEGNLCKFTQNTALRDFLLSTGDRIIAEASPKDCIWGIGLAEDDPLATVPAKWPGTNLLGFVLMEVRRRIRAESEYRKESDGSAEKTAATKP